MKVILLLTGFSIVPNFDQAQFGKKRFTGSGDQLLSKTSQVGAFKYDKFFAPKKHIIPDFFEIDSSQITKYKAGHHAGWFITKDLKSRLYFVTYTDYSITTAILSRSGKFSSDDENLLKSDGVKIQDTDNAIKSKKFVSRKGFKLGLSRKFAIDTYGKPKSKKRSSSFETLKWEFKMKEGPVKKKNGFLTPFILDDLSFYAEMIFKHGRLYTLIYRYEVP